MLSELSLNKPYGSLSKGQRRWVLTSLALACHPTLVLLDEPADGLDPAARKALYDSVRDHVNAEEATAIVTTHHIADVERIADEVAIIANGTLTLHAPLEDLRDRARLVETPDGTTPADLDGLVTLLGKAAPNGDRIVMLNRDITDDELRRQLGGNAEIRHVGLEELYLAVAGQT